jgi:hypothetical protein
VKCYELHYQQKNVETPDGKQIMQYRCLNFLALRDSSLKFSIAIKNKWSARRMKSWFYCCVSCRRSSRGVKSMYALRSRMSEFDYVVEPEVECPDDDLNDATFVRATTTIGGRDAALSLFAMGPITAVHTDHFLAGVEMEAERVLGTFGPREYNALGVVNILNGSRLNRVLEQMGVPYTPRPRPGSKASQAANKKRKAEVSKKPAAKSVKAGPSRAPPSKMAPPRPKVGSSKKVGVLMIARPKAKPGPQGTSEIELALAKTIGVSKKFCLLDVAASSHEPYAVGATTTARVLAFDNLDDDSLIDLCETPPQQKMIEKCACLPHFVSGEVFYFSFALFTAGPDVVGESR